MVIKVPCEIILLKYGAIFKAYYLATKDYMNIRYAQNCGATLNF